MTQLTKEQEAAIKAYLKALPQTKQFKNWETDNAKWLEQATKTTWQDRLASGGRVREKFDDWLTKQPWYNSTNNRSSSYELYYDFYNLYFDYEGKEINKRLTETVKTLDFSK